MGLRCPTCGYPVEDGDNFCANGHDLAADPPGEGNPIGKAPETDENAETMRLDGIVQGLEPVACLEVDDRIAAKELLGSTPIETDMELDIPPGGRASIGMGCSDFKVEYNVGRVFVEGHVFPFQFRLIPLQDHIEDLFLEIRRGGQLIAREEPDENLYRGLVLGIPIPFRPTSGVHGKIPFDLYMGYRLKGQGFVFKARQVHTVFPAQAPAQSVIHDLRVEYHNTMGPGNANDMQLDQRLRGLEALRPQVDDSAEKIIQKLDTTPIWKPLSMHACNYRHAPMNGLKPCRPPSDSAPVAARCDRLVLQAGSHSVFVYSNPRLIMGRGGLQSHITDNPDILTRIRLRSGAEDRTPIRGSDGKRHKISICISRFHGQIEADTWECLVHDKAWNPVEKRFQHSGRGTYLDATRIQPPGGSVRLPTDRLFSLTLAGPSVANEGVFGFTGMLYTAGRVRGDCRACACEGDPKALAGWVLQDQLCDLEAWACVWRALPLAAIDPSWGAGCLCRCGEGFLVRIENRCEWLVPGRPLVLPGLTLQVNPFEKGCI